MEAYNNLMDKVGDAIIDWADADKTFRHGQDWWLCDFRSAITIALAYVAFVLVGSTIMKSGMAPIDPYPIKFLYNVSQIFLCAYMTSRRDF